MKAMLLVWRRHFNSIRVMVDVDICFIISRGLYHYLIVETAMVFTQLSIEFIIIKRFIVNWLTKRLIVRGLTNLSIVE